DFSGAREKPQKVLVSTIGPKGISLCGATFFARGGKEGKTPLDPTVAPSRFSRLIRRANRGASSKPPRCIRHRRRFGGFPLRFKSPARRECGEKLLC
ncbi:MAG: hypothetical protein II094_01145, partial [Oscillospiraceae bacterium]|nr:hypothetical protein [Oscillospiraceae bacterium]